MKHRMTCGVFVSAFFILFATLFCLTAGAAVKVVESNEPKWTTLLKGEKVKKPPEVSKMPDGENNVPSLGFPALFEVGDAVVAMAEVLFKSGSKDYVGISAVVMDKEGKWGNTKTVWQDFSNTQKVFLFNPTVIVTEDNKVSVILAGHGRQKKPLERTAADLSWKPLIASGTTKDERREVDTSEGTKYFEWQQQIERVENGFPVDKNTNADEYSQSDLRRFLGGEGIVVQLGNKKYVVPVHGAIENKEHVFFVAFPENKVERKFQGEPAASINCFDPVIINWTENKDFMITPCDNGNYRVFEVSNGNTWDIYGGMLSGMWGNNKARKGTGIRAGFTSAEINKKTVALFTQPMQKEGGENNYELHLWLTDMNHTYDIGKISDGEENVKASTLLYKKGENTEAGNDKLYCLYEVVRDKKTDIVFVNLTDKLEQIKEVLEKWKEVDDAILNHLCSLGKNGVLSAENCPKFVPTKDLVSYFTDKLTNENKTWVDEYLHMNATINGGTPVPNGLKFSGPGAGAKWEMNTGEQNRPYHFANYEFTLVATVTIHKEPKTEREPLLGIALYGEDGTTKRVGLCYTRKRKWSVTDELSEETEGLEKMNKDKKWNVNKSHQVAMSLKGKAFNLIVDGKYFENDYEDSTVHLDQNFDISHIYIGDSSSDKTAIDVTISNVFVYAREIYPNNLDILGKITTISTKPTDKPNNLEFVAKEQDVIKNVDLNLENANVQSPSHQLQQQQQTPPKPQQSGNDSAKGAKVDVKQEMNEMHTVSVRKDVVDTPTDVQSQGEIADDPQDNLSQNNVSNGPVQGKEQKQTDEREVELQPESQGENAKLAPSSTPITAVVGGDTQSPEPAAQPHGNATSVNMSNIAEMIGKNAGGDGTVHERMSLVLLLMGFLAVLAAPH